MKRFEERKQDLINANNRLKEALNQEESDLMIDGVLHGEIWLKMMLARNSLSHLYDEETSRQVYNEVKNRYIYQFEKLINSLV